MQTDDPSRKILLADDEAHIVYILSGKLSSAGYEVITARNGVEALALAKVHCPDLVITDYNMPEMDGMELSIGLRDMEQTAQVPVIMLTGRGHTVSPQDQQRTNICQLESKPFSARHMLELVERVLAVPVGQ